MSSARRPLTSLRTSPGYSQEGRSRWSHRLLHARRNVHSEIDPGSPRRLAEAPPAHRGSRGQRLRGRGFDRLVGRLDHPPHLVGRGTDHVRIDQHDPDQDDIGRNKFGRRAIGRFDLLVAHRSGCPMQRELVDRPGRGRLGRFPPNLERCATPSRCAPDTGALTERERSGRPHNSERDGRVLGTSCVTCSTRGAGGIWSLGSSCHGDHSPLDGLVATTPVDRW